MKINRPNQAFQIVAHRGLSNQFPENTLLSFKAALMQHVDMLEIDVHFSKDHHLVVIHDDTIDRTSNGKGKVKDYTFEELATFDFGIKHNPSFINTKISKFEEVLSLSKNYSKTLLIEIKVPHQYPGIEEAVLKALKAYKVPEHKAIIQSFDDTSVKRLRSLGRVYPLGLLVSRKKYWYKSPDFEAISQYADFINPNYKLVTSKFIKNAHRHSLKVIPYTVNHSKDAKKLIRLGVDGIISDLPEALFKL
ncbi:glycerophosphodiester phosphodiesterase family protein [Staphylococcus borealis]|uniref:glycerophosphodiester phosphodiesterase n=1 Tax=Staphylococcus borealis TaxID=2742203 RepID=UPI002A815408|nr:glycerophosphodiester phosphodiesterase family protein [Staphylococcus borealis]MDY4021768.1 glycerophosphodiester phosphodiesterase family protein [Staphylococcus borealis]